MVSVEVKIVPCKPFVDVTYIPYHDKEAAMQRFIKESNDGTSEFVECLAYSTNEYVVMLGTMTSNTSAAPLNAIGLWHKEWFYLHVKKYLKTGKEGHELVPLRDYYHRHTKSLFWEISDIVPFGNNILFRWIFGWMMPPKPSLLKLTQTEALRKLYELHHVVQDMLVPIEKLGECLTVFDKEVDIYPLWLCPFKIPTNAKNDVKDRGTNIHCGFFVFLPIYIYVFFVLTSFLVLTSFFVLISFFVVSFLTSPVFFITILKT